MRRFSASCLLWLLLSFVALPVAADVVTDWNTTLLNAIRTTRTNPPLATRHMALLHTAIFDAVNGIDQQYEPYRVVGPGPTGGSLEAAAAAAGHEVLSALFPALRATFDAQLAAHLAAVPDGQSETDGVAWGRGVAVGILQIRSSDGASTPLAYQAPLGSSWWVPTPPAFASPLLPQWPGVTPWAMTSGAQFRAPGPPLLTDDAYLVAFLEVQRFGRSDSSVRNADQTEIALFWNDGAGTQTPPGHWFEIAQTLALAQGNSLTENARLFALLGITVADAAISCWDTKYHFGHWRPITANANAATDGNRFTVTDPGWTSLIPTPPFPSHTSGHSTFSGSSSRLLQNFFGSDALAFSAVSDGTPSVTRSFTSLSQAAEEAGQSRIYGGIHYQYENRGGLAAGRALADYVFANLLRPVGVSGPQPPCVASATRLCLDNGRFAVEVEWRARRGGSSLTVGRGNADSISGQSGSFWFFEPENSELLVKVLDGCAVNGHRWVFAGGATNVEYLLHVTDTQTGTTKTYFNPLDHMASAVLDTSAFATCP